MSRDKRVQGIVQVAKKIPTGSEMYSSDRKSVQVYSEIDRTTRFPTLRWLHRLTVEDWIYKIYQHVLFVEHPLRESCTVKYTSLS